ncbi:hypothetical protein KAM355_09680 [Aeromonas caviae]|uniref:Uncharacterized protein n=1 Tax=Aeromonas caviae TaxID=648 RepID=A0ABD0B4F3_AERCA|nr:hypothetical protein KAM376_25830 [Aeromonas caviae]GJA80408.1 hypothetical protein KAM355_09680 [Aeromonas caviae]GJB11356.1 hypothetical protein KAM362_19160 [Aeromonas caviae]GJB45194.1 hypothetical protein KAM370_11360 [Aeromonas caviae]GJB63777.1 hypothetical protein KAM375_18310 [Aeromonas caviae]
MIGGGAARELADQQGAEGKGAESTKGRQHDAGRLAKGVLLQHKGIGETIAVEDHKRKGLVV